jgi:cytochrome c-type biogenesis protein CcmH/NrfF
MEKVTDCDKPGNDLTGNPHHGRTQTHKKRTNDCVSKIEVSPLTAKLKCPHGRGKDIYESEAVTEVDGDGFG